MKANAIPSPEVEAAEMASRFAALGSEHRLAVLRALVRAGDAGLGVAEIGARTGLTGATLTHHLKALSSVGLIVQARDGRRIVSSVDHGAVRGLSAFLLRECCADVEPTGERHRHD
ncbi:MAG: ArsR/SmtB family transcription factor [Paracoccaceae bacterium]